MRVLVTGAGGWLGVTVVDLLSTEHTVRAHDLEPIASPGLAAEATCGDLRDFKIARAAVHGMDAVVHLVTASGLGITTPADWVAAGAGVAANVFAAAADEGVTRFVLMSSGAVVAGRRGTVRIDSTTPPLVSSAYGMTKWLEEVIGHYYATERGLVVPILRPWTIIDAETRTFKGRSLPLDDGGLFSHNGAFGWVDRADVAQACQLALIRPLTGAPVFHLFANKHAEEQFDLSAAHDTLGWAPRHRFDAEPSTSDEQRSPDR